MEKYTAISIKVSGVKDADEIDWRIMKGVRTIARSSGLFDPAMIACTAGRLMHARACELDNGMFMVVDINDEKVVAGGVVLRNQELPIVPNHRCVTVVRNGDYLVLSLGKGSAVPMMIPGKPFTIAAENDKQYAPFG